MPIFCPLYSKRDNIRKHPSFVWGSLFFLFLAHYVNIYILNFFRPDLMVKKLRYYARFIVVCLLLKKMKLVRDLVRELAKHIDEYTATYEPEDQLGK